MKRNWGDIPVVYDTDSGIAALEREQMTKIRPMEVEGPRLHQPSSRHYPPAAEPYPAEHFALDSVTAHTIQLIQHARKVRQLISSYQQALEHAKTTDTEPPLASFAPPVPEYDGPLVKHRMQRPVPYLPWEPDGAFARGLGKPPPELDSTSCRRLLRRSVAAILAHAGYEISPESLLDTLTDLCQQYLTQMCGLMRHAVDAETQSGTTGFQDVIEQVFHEMGLSGTTALFDFYQHRVIDYHQNMIQQCQQLMDEYERLSNPDLRAAEEIKLARMKEEFSDIQFPSNEESEETVDPDTMLNLEACPQPRQGANKGETKFYYGLGGFEVGIVQESEEDSRWPGAHKPESQEPKKAGCIDALTKKKLFDKVQSRVGMASMESNYDQGGGEDQTASEPPSTPQLGSEAGDSLADPASVPTAELVSPPPLALKPAKMPRK